MKAKCDLAQLPPPHQANRKEKQKITKEIFMNPIAVSSTKKFRNLFDRIDQDDADDMRLYDPV